MGHSYDLNSNTVRALFEDSEHRIWMGKRDGQIEIYSSDLDFQGILTEEGGYSQIWQVVTGSSLSYHARFSRKHLDCDQRGWYYSGRKEGPVLSLLDSNMMKMIFIA